MLARIHKSMDKKEEGFTLIELLVVIIIIGILAAIAIPVFLHQREKAVDAGIKSDLHSIANEVESYYVDYQKYPADAAVTGVGAGSATVSVAGVSVDKSNNDTVFTYKNNTSSYQITGQNSTAGTKLTYTYDSAAGGLNPQGK